MSGLLYTQNHDLLLVRADNDAYALARPMLSLFSELVQNMDPIHMYKIRPTTLWQAASSGLDVRSILQFLRESSENPLPYPMQRFIVDTMGKWELLRLHLASANHVILRGNQEALLLIRQFKDLLDAASEIREDGIVFPTARRAFVKQQLMRHGYPVRDEVGYQEAPHLALELGSDVQLRPYQVEAVHHFFAATSNQSGVVVLPCGAGKTIVGLTIATKLQVHTLVVTPNESSARQWLNEFLAKTNIAKNDIALYNNPQSLAPVTITTYQRVTAKNRKGQFRHLDALTSHLWGLVIYDEVHMLPAPLFRLAADLQGARRLGLTATLIREDGAENEVFSLIGGKCYELPWKQLEDAGYLASVTCHEIRVALPAPAQQTYAQASIRQQHRIAADNPEKIHIVKKICQRYNNDSILIMGHYLAMLEQLANELNCPMLHGQTGQDERARVLEQFRKGKIRILALSRIANMAIDVPCASIAIQISGLYGSRQEEAQRLGRLLRPGSASGRFYTLVSAQTVEERMARHRQTFLVEQGYAYNILSDVDFDQGEVDVHEIIRMREHG